MMLRNKRIQEIIQQKIENDEYIVAKKLGDYSIDEISPIKRILIQGKECWELKYKYTIIMFNFKDDVLSLGKTYEYLKKIILDNEGLIIDETKKELLKESD